MRRTRSGSLAHRRPSPPQAPYVLPPRDVGRRWSRGWSRGRPACCFMPPLTSRGRELPRLTGPGRPRRVLWCLITPSDPPLSIRGRVLIERVRVRSFVQSRAWQVGRGTWGPEGGPAWPRPDGLDRGRHQRRACRAGSLNQAGCDLRRASERSAECRVHGRDRHRRARDGHHRTRDRHVRASNRRSRRLDHAVGQPGIGRRTASGIGVIRGGRDE